MSPMRTEDFDAALVGVVFTPEAAVEAVNRHIATDEVITVLNELLDGQDPRVEDLEFEQDDYDPWSCARTSVRTPRSP